MMIYECYWLMVLEDTHSKLIHRQLYLHSGWVLK